MTALQISALAIVAAISVPVSAQEKPDARREAAHAVQDALQLLERDQVAKFLETYLRPSELERVLATRTLDQAAAEFKAKRAADLLAALRVAAKMAPTMNEDGSGARFEFEKPIGGHRRVSVVKIGDRWYFR